MAGHLDHVMNEISKNNRPVRFRVLRNTKYKGEIEVDITMTPFYDKGSFAGYFGIMRPTERPEVIDIFDYPVVNEENQIHKLTNISSEKNTQNSSIINNSVVIIMLSIVSLALLAVALISKNPIQEYMLSLVGISIASILIPTLKISKNGVNKKEIGMQLVKALFDRFEKNADKEEKI